MHNNYSGATSSTTYGPIEFLLTAMATDMTAPQAGKHTLKAYYAVLKKAETQHPG